MLLRNGASVNASNSYGATSLCIVASQGHVSIVLALLEKRTDVSSTTQDRVTPIHAAVENGHAKIVAALLANGAHVDTANMKETTPLFVASQHGHVAVVSVLLENRVNVDVVDPNEATPLYNAALQGHTDMVSLLLKKQANVEMVSLLLEHHASVDAANAEGVTPLCYAADEGGHSASFRRSKRPRASRKAAIGCACVSGSCKFSRSPPFIAARNGYVNVMRVLLGSHASATAAPAAAEGTTPLHFAAHFGHEAVATMLRTEFPSDTSVNVIDGEGYTPVLQASKAGHSRVVEALLRTGATVNVRAVDGETLLVSATRWEDLSTVALLFDLGSFISSSSTSDGAESLLSATLQTLTDFGAHTYEFQDMWTCTVDRLLDVCDCITKKSKPPIDNIHQLVMVVYRLLKLKVLCSYASNFARLVASPAIVRRFRELHAEVTFLQRDIDPDSAELAGTSWKSQ